MTERRIGVFTPNRENAEVSAGLSEAFERVLRSGRYTLGPELEAFETAAAEFLGTSEFVGVGSGTDALILTLQALGARRGDRVVVPGFGAVPTVAAVQFAGATPVLADVDPATGCLSEDSVAAVVDDRTVGVVVVHLYGYPCELAGIRTLCEKKGLFLVEDCAQAFGAFRKDGSGREAVGTSGQAGCFSFYPTKVLAGLGDGGGVATYDVELARSLRLMRSHGHVGDYRHEMVARNSRMDEVQAAFLRVKLERLPQWLKRRREVAAALREAIACATGGAVQFQADSEGHAYHLLAARHRLRDAIVASCRKRGVDLMVHYPLAISDQKAYEGLPGDECAESRLWAATEFSLPTSPQLAPEEVERVAAAVSEAMSEALEEVSA